MPAAKDFRSTPPFDVTRVDGSGRDVGRSVYWKLYAIENTMRVVIHSVLTAQIGPNWWLTAADVGLQKKAQRFKSNYSASPWHSSPGGHDIYYVDLSDLNETIRANSHLFLPIIRDVDQWMARIEQVRLPRNVVAHMNWPSATDRQRIGVLYSDVRTLASHVAASIQLAIP
jgi:hypothetical protein